ncbi:DNA-binding protein [Rhizobium ruizarguesonis]|uniref:DNA-binding protein n=1 Tax=Rhizobium ruizarguesonis TaxID=2081791 RepID=A0AB38HW87_9HYPH|nr:DNA-binding protein [Rhizobium ruizarguesonis]TBA13876.1 DNA-binding protein [Rhizobium ruizarguesonis]TBB58507.1 DNA-binding protein [Rhizobium ruizarguesonis]TBB60450.1 DNA-binding protein [Rhizobium ruizarguesonis]TBB83507.1 DNA-binding protein [Rhizobium ruizarguesonis]TBC04679.1 DNA-binding protein [Rhizobium ruizarguesonis]
MTYSNSLSDETVALVLDTSVLINLHASRCGVDILTSIPNPIVVANVVAGELENETSRRNGEEAFLRELSTAGHVTLVDMSDQEFEMFFELTSVSPSLDDGEAATIALANARGLYPVIDEKRGRARANAIMGVEPAWSLDLVLHPMTAESLGAEADREALFRALRDGRMRIPPESTSHVVGIIGIENAEYCTCLPGYKQLFARRDQQHQRVGRLLL